MNAMNDYTVINGRVTNPGKFQGEPAWAAYFYALDDDLQVDDGACVVYRACQASYSASAASSHSAANTPSS